MSFDATTSTTPTPESSETSESDGTTTTTTTIRTTAEAATTTGVERVEVAADGEHNTAPFELAGGRYVVEYAFASDCYYSARLIPVDDGAYGEALATGTDAVSGTTNVYRVKAGTYYVRMITGPVPGCPWRIVLTRQ